jgi:hypothetical protein
MHKDRIAEWLLSQVTTRERAVSTVGDLTEAAATHAAGWFWSNVVRTLASLLWRGFADAPGPMLGLALRAWLLSLALALAALLCIVVLAAIFGLAYAMLTSAIGSVNGAFTPGGVFVWVAKAVGLAVAVLCQFQVGRWLARRAPGREVSACLALLMLQWIPAAMIGLGAALATRNSGWLPSPEYLLLGLPCLAGALWVRRRALR